MYEDFLRCWARFGLSRVCQSCRTPGKAMPVIGPDSDIDLPKLPRKQEQNSSARPASYTGGPTSA